MAETASDPSNPRRRGSLAPPLWIWAPIAAVVALAALPLAYVGAQAATVGWAGTAALLFRPFVANLLLNTLTLAVSVTTGALLVGTAAAWLVERSDLAGRAVWRVLGAAAARHAGPGLGLRLAVADAAGRGDAGRRAGADPRRISPRLPAGSPPPCAAWTRRSRTWRAPSAHGPWRIFGRTVLPQLVPALSGGLLLVTLHMLVEFGPLALLRVETFTTAIYEAYELSYDGAAAAMLSAVLIALCLGIMTAELLLRGRRRFTRPASGATAPHVRARLGWIGAPAAAGLVALIGLALGLPVAMLGYWLLLARHAPLPWDKGVVRRRRFGGTLGPRGRRHHGGGAAAGARGLPPARPGRGAGRAIAIRGACPAGASWWRCRSSTSACAPRPFLYQTTALLLVGYAILFLPLAQTALRPAIEQVPPAMEEVALALGRAPWRVLLTVTLPNILPGLGAAALLVFMQLMKELTATLVLAPTGIRTLSIELWAQSSQMKYGSAAPFAALLVVVSGVPAYWATVQLQRRRGRA